MAEMQGLMVHKLLSEPERATALYGDIHERLADYNARYYPKGQTRRATDHLVYYGSYTNDVAHFVGIERRVRDAFSWKPWRWVKDLSFELLHPNNAVKFRMRGEYAVEGAEAYARGIAEHYEHWGMIRSLFLSVLWDKLLALLCIGLLFLRQGVAPFVDLEAGGVRWDQAPGLIAWGGLSAALVALLHRYQYVVNLISYSLPLPVFGLKASLQPLAMLYVAYTGRWSLGLAIFAFWMLVAWAGRQVFLPPISGRYLFADCKYKHRYRPFWQRYRKAFLQVRAERLQRLSSAPPPSMPPVGEQEPLPGERLPGLPD